MGRKKVDLTGQRFGKLVVLRECEERSSCGKIQWTCLCDCGKQSNIAGGHLRSGSNKSCGCGMKSNLKDKRFGMLVVLGDSGKRNSAGAIVWDCICDCGEKSKVTTGSLTSGQIKSCGCRKGRHVNLVGQKFGRLTVIAVAEKTVRLRVSWECLCECGARTQTTTNALTTGHTRSCGCFKLDVLASMSGENSQNYNPDLTDEERLKNRYQLNGNNIVTWRTNIYTRDNYTCQICAKHGVNLNAHHLNAWKSFPEQRFDLDNGVTLCVDCHKEFHKMYGRGDNTREQFDEYAASKTLVLN